MKEEEEEEVLVTPVKPQTVTMFYQLTPEKVETSKQLTTEHEDVEVVVVEKINTEDIEATTTTTTVITTTTKTIVTNDEDEATKIDVKKEIAISILNVGEVLAKTIDRYSIDMEPQQQQQEKEEVPIIIIKEQLNDSSASFSSPSDLISSLSSSSVMSSSPNKQIEENKAEGGEQEDEDDENMSFLIREIENQLAVQLDQLDLHADEMITTANGLSMSESKKLEEEKTERHVEQQPERAKHWGRDMEGCG